LAPDPSNGRQPRKAILRLFSTAQTSGAQAVIGVFRCRQGHDVPDQEPILGLAAKYPRDQGVAKDPDVIFFTDFEADCWRDEWSQVANRNANETVAADPARKFEPLTCRRAAPRAGRARAELHHGRERLARIRNGAFRLVTALSRHSGPRNERLPGWPRGGRSVR
jgi:hypothetical protein